MAITEAATVPVIAPELPQPVEQVLGEAAALEDRAHQGEEGNRQQRVVGEDAEHTLGERLHEGELEHALLDGDEAEEQADRREREGDRVADQHEQDEAAEHQRRHQVMRDHWSGLS